MEAITSRPLLLAGVGRATKHAEQSTLLPGARACGQLQSHRNDRQHQAGLGSLKICCAAVGQYQSMACVR